MYPIQIPYSMNGLHWQQLIRVVDTELSVPDPLLHETQRWYAVFRRYQENY